MKKLIIFINLLLLCLSVFGETFRTGETLGPDEFTYYFPEGTPMIRRGNSVVDTSKCFVSKIAKAPGYSDGSYEVQLTACTYVGTSAFPIIFTYILKPYDNLRLIKCSKVDNLVKGGAKFVNFKVMNITDNLLVLTESTAATAEDSATDELVDIMKKEFSSSNQVKSQVNSIVNELNRHVD